ncbi:MAG: hypothetical protein EBT91_02215 [Rhodobacteraceae bacterium]|jgi:hypothetical protein|nr:hypothetical protein [Paracoccaceae bacterium]
MTHISTQPQNLTIVPVQTSGLKKLASAVLRIFRSRADVELDINHSSDHNLRDLGAERGHERQHPSTMGRMF